MRVTHQEQLRSVVQLLFPEENIITNARKEGKIVNPATGLYWELDLFLPNHKICFEFQDLHHYATTWYSQTPLATIKSTDNYKNEYVQQRADTLIVVPYWWHGDHQSLSATIHFHRPDLIPQSLGSPIPLNPEKQQQTNGVPDIGELMLAAFPSGPLFTNSDLIFEKQEIFWWIGEKYDGIRFCYHPSLKIVYGRSGKPIHLPEAFHKQFSGSVFLDGELWFGRGGYINAQEVLLLSNAMNKRNSRLNNNENNFENDDEDDCDEDVNVHQLDLSDMRAIVFDDATPIMNWSSFETRYESIFRLFSYDHPFMRVATRIKIGGKAKLQRPELQQPVDATKLQDDVARLQSCVVRDGGEGIMLRKPCSRYIHGRSSDLLKIKASLGDQEALVVGVEPTIYHMQLPNGVTFEVPTEKVKEGLNPIKGDVVTFSFNSDVSRRSVPVDPFVFRIRFDLSWDHLIEDEEQKQQQNKKTFVTKPKGYWVSESARVEMRTFFEKFIRFRFHLDPLLSSSWYSLSSSDFADSPEGLSIIGNFNGSLIRALVYLFPEISFDESKFVILPRGYLEEAKNRRKVFEQIAEKHGKDPLSPSTWYSSSLFIIKPHSRESNIVAAYYKGSVVKCLYHLFPEIGLDQRLFPHVPQNYWNEERQREFFCKLARERGFDPLVASLWYSIHPHEIYDQKYWKSVLYHHNNNCVSALMSLFPDIGLEKNKFKYIAKLMDSRWEDKNNRKEYFIEYARNHNFDPRVADNWYSISKFDFIDSKDAESILSFYGGSFIRALIKLFPEVSFDKTKFLFSKNKGNWEEEKNRREYFISLAKENLFDPKIALNWYSIDPNTALYNQNTREVLAYHEGSWINALIHLFPDLSLLYKNFVFLEDSYWQQKDNRRKVFIQLARDNNIDPFIPDHWYSVSEDTFLSAKNMMEVMYYYQGNFAKCLVSLFPDVPLNINKFPTFNSNWLSVKNRRNFFVTFARDHSFDALLPSNWYPITIGLLLPFKGARNVLVHYKGNVPKALLQLFPEIGLNINHFLLLPTNFWKDKNNQKQVINNFAKKNKFDPRVASNWYSVTSQDLQKEKGGNAVLAVYKGNLNHALTTLFPDIGLDPSRFFSKKNTVTIKRGRNALFQYANERGFDPLLPSNWYSVDLSHLLKYKGIQSFLTEYNGDITKALLHIFPEIGLKSNLLENTMKNANITPRNPWMYESYRKKLFVDYAKEMRFDPHLHSNWENVNWDSFLSKKGASSVMFFYKGNRQKAIQQLFPK